MNAIHPHSKPLTAKELAAEINLPEQTIKTLMRKRVLPVMKIGYRTHRYDLAACLSALSKRSVKAI